MFLTFNVIAQDYTPFPINNAFWSATQCEPGPFSPKFAFVKVGVFGDTTIGTETYHKLYLQGEFTNSFQCDTCGFDFDITNENTNYFMCYREENKVIYFVPQENSFGDPEGTEYPIFDFNLTTVGETIVAYENIFLPYNADFGFGALQAEVTLTVQSIDSVLMSDETYRRRINFEPLTYGLQESWIEGIGSTKGFGFSLNVTNFYNSMICYSHDGVSLEGPEIRSEQSCTSTPDLDFSDQCEFTSASALSVDEVYNSSDVNIFPNPFTESFQITGVAINDEVVIYDILGHVIYKEIANSNELQLSLAGFKSAVYYCSITKPSGDRLIKKIVKN